MLELSTAQTEEDFADVYSFWYEIYVSEMGRHINDTNTSHEHHKLYDPLATAGSLCLARENGVVVGTSLITPVDHPATEKYRSLYQLDALSPEAQWKSAVTTKLMCKSNLRRTRLPMRLAFAAYNWGLHVGIEQIYIDCNDHLVKLFSRLGFEQHLPSLFHKDYGQVNSMRLETNNEKRFRELGSPLLAVLNRYQREQGIVSGNRPQPVRGTRRIRVDLPAPDIQSSYSKQGSPEPAVKSVPAA